MGVFDTILVKRKLPLTKEIKKAFSDTDWSNVGFQTKDLDNTMTTYTIKGTGLYYEKVEGEHVRVVSEEEEKKKRKQGKFCWPYEFKETSRKTVKEPFHGTINFYHYDEDKDGNTWDIEFDATFISGKLSSIKLSKAKIVSTAEENRAREKEWSDRVTARLNHPWTKTKNILNKITFSYWGFFWRGVARGLAKLGKVFSSAHFWVYRNMY